MVRSNFFRFGIVVFAMICLSRCTVSGNLYWGANAIIRFCEISSGANDFPPKMNIDHLVRCWIVFAKSPAGKKMDNRLVPRIALTHLLFIIHWHSYCQTVSISRAETMCASLEMRASRRPPIQPNSFNSAVALATELLKSANSLCLLTRNTCFAVSHVLLAPPHEIPPHLHWMNASKWSALRAGANLLMPFVIWIQMHADTRVRSLVGFCMQTTSKTTSDFLNSTYYQHLLRKRDPI